MSNSPTESAHDTDLIGVGGWLAFLALVLIVISPLMTVFTTIAEHSRTASQYPELVNQNIWRSAVVLDWSMAALSAAISVIAGLMLLKIFRRSTVSIVIALIWLGAVGTAALSLVLSDYLMSGSVNAGNAGATLGRPIGFCLIWTLYLLISRRVKNTYVSTE